MFLSNSSSSSRKKDSWQRSDEDAGTEWNHLSVSMFPAASRIQQCQDCLENNYMDGVKIRRLITALLFNHWCCLFPNIWLVQECMQKGLHAPQSNRRSMAKRWKNFTQNLMMVSVKSQLISKAHTENECVSYIRQTYPKRENNPTVYQMQDYKIQVMTMKARQQFWTSAQLPIVYPCGFSVPNFISKLSLFLFKVFTSLF